MKYVSYWLVSLCLFVSTNVFAENSHHDKHKAHSRIGMHGMVMFTDGVDLYASHLPLYRAPHDYQLVYIIETKYKTALVQRLTQAKQQDAPLFMQNMVTLLPAKFDLNKLIEGQSFTIETQMFSGHFERGGKLWLKDENFKFVRQIYKRPLANLSSNPSAENWQLFNTAAKQEKLFIYNIQTSPSFDAIILGKGCPNAESYQVPMSSPVPTHKQLTKEFNICQSNQVLYFETRDFAQ